jgi:two-component system, chemotaxis family, chemotaxis protein CheY
MPKTILVVDDSATIRQQVTIALSQAGFTVLEAIDGIDGLGKIEACPELALVICDVNMPRMNGLDMVEAIKQRDGGGKLPIVMLTTEGDPSLVARAKQAGAKGWIVKPFKPELLVAAARKLAA